MAWVKSGFQHLSVEKVVCDLQGQCYHLMYLGDQSICPPGHLHEVVVMSEYYNCYTVEMFLWGSFRHESGCSVVWHRFLQLIFQCHISLRSHHHRQERLYYSWEESGFLWSLLYLVGEVTELQNLRIIESQNHLGQKGLSEVIQSNCPAVNRDTYSYIRLLRSPSSLTLNVSRDGRSLGNLSNQSAVSTEDTTQDLSYYFIWCWLLQPLSHHRVREIQIILDNFSPIIF